VKKLIGALIGVLLFCAVHAPASAMDRVQFLYGQNPPSSWANYAARYTRLGFGQLIFDLYGITSGFYSNLTANPTSGLFVAVGPSSANTVGSVYQYLPEESTSFGGPGGTSLSADPNQVYLQGLTYTAGNAIGPLAIGTSGGQAVIDLIECKVQTVDQTSQTGTFVSTLGVVTTSAVNRDRSDTVSCQFKASVSSATPTLPSVDAGYIAVGYFTIPFGTVTVTGAMYTPTLTDRFSALSSPLYTITGATVPGSPHSVILPLTTSVGLTTCGPMVSYYCGTVSLTGAAQFTGPTTFSCGPFSEQNPQGAFSAAYYGGWLSYTLTGTTYLLFFTWNTGSTVYVGGTWSGYSSSAFSIICTGY